MFCPSCGKTINPDWKKCRHCSAPVGESRFDGVPYTSAQARIAPGQAQYKDDARQYTRTTYTGDPEARSVAAVDARTTYRPVYEGSSVPEDMRQDLRAAAGADDEPPEREYPEERARRIDPEDLERNIEGFDISQIKSRPIIAKKPAGLSSDVKEYVKRLETGEERPVRRGRHLSPADPYVQDESGEGAPPEEEYVADEPQGIDRMKIIKIVAALVAVAALFVVGIYIAPKIIDQFRNRVKVPIEGVTVKLYQDGLALIQSHTQDQYKQDVLQVYEAGGYAALISKLESDKSALSALMPAEPSVNDQLFIDALAAVQTDIGNALIFDAVEIAADGAADSSESVARWASVNESVANLKLINSAQGLTAVVNGERIDEYTQPTPEPQASPTPAYPTLSKGDQGEKVKYMQERLWDLGWLSDDRDGKFGANTMTAVKLFQEQAGLEGTGIADPATLAAMFAEDAPLGPNARITPKPSPTAEPTEEPTVEPSPSAAT